MNIKSEEWNKLIIEGASKLGVNVSSREVEKLAVHADEVLKWNKVSNLTAIKDPYEVGVKHVIDSLAAANYIGSGSKLLDIGTGGGFPGVPLKIVKPELTVTLVDAVRKKISFLKHVIRELGLTGIEACHARAEELSQHEEHSASYDIIICRAFSSLENFVTMAAPFLKKGGTMIAMKSKGTDEEIEKFKGFTAEIEGFGAVSFDDLEIETKAYNLPGIDHERSVILMKIR